MGDLSSIQTAILQKAFDFIDDFSSTQLLIVICEFNKDLTGMTIRATVVKGHISTLSKAQITASPQGPLKDAVTAFQKVIGPVIKEANKTSKTIVTAVIAQEDKASRLVMSMSKLNKKLDDFIQNAVDQEVATLIDNPPAN